MVGLTDPSGTVANSYAYDPYGNVVNSSTTVGNPFEYVSGWTSGVTTFTHFGVRWYASDPNFTRWTQQDPVVGSLGNPTSQCRCAPSSARSATITEGRCGELGAQGGGAVQVDVAQLGGRLVGVDMQQHTHAARHAAGDGNLARAEQRHLVPAELPRRPRWMYGVEVVGEGEERAGDGVR